ncbi:MAG TPA: PqqD family protein [Gemmatimonadaceae bacterium]|jgi:hypothetical protein|nr:PqqD family protein [Gemmatimonadaceae bacterium]
MNATPSRVSLDVLTAHLNDETVLLHLGTKRYFHLNVTGQRIWQLLEEGVSEDALAGRIAAEFDTSPVAVAAEVQSLLTTLRECGLVEGGASTESR